MVDLRRIPIAACVLMVILRMSIGWQFLYEGLWKLDSKNSATPWSAEGYLKNAQGPFRDMFRNMTGDPDDLNWLDYDKMSTRWMQWRERFLAQYADLTDGQKQQLDDLLTGPAEFSVPLAKLPEGVEIKGAAAKVVKYDAAGKRLVVDGKQHLIPKERDDLQKLAPGDSKDAVAFRKAVDDLYKKQSKLSYLERLAASLKGDPSRTGVILEDQKDTIDYKRMGDIEIYKEMLARYEELRKKVDVAYEQQHLDRTWQELQAKKNEVVGPIRAMDKQLQADAWKILNAIQMQEGAVSPPPGPIDRVNWQTTWSLIILGGLLLGGLASRPAAFIGALMVLMFYLPQPPWPGVPEAPGPEHSFIINKNLIEVFALLAIAAMPTGQWFGIDRLFRKLLYREKKTSASAKPEA